MNAKWAIKKINDICDFRGGGTPSKATESYWRGDIPWVSPKDMKFDVITDSIDHISSEAIEESTTNLISSGSVLVVVRSGILARTVPVAIAGRDVAINQDIKALCPHEGIDSWFLFYFLKSRLEEMLALASRGATVHRIMADQIRAIEIPVPPLPEQKRIVGILDEAFGGLATAQAHAAQNLQNARDLFESHLNAVFTQRGDGWVETIIGDCIHFIDYRGKTPEKTTSGLRLITAKNVKMGFLQREPEEFVAMDSYDGWMTRGIPRKGDVLFTTEAPLANIAQLDTADKVVFAQRIIIMQSHSERLDSTFLKYLLLSKPIQDSIHAKGTGATVKGIKASLLKTIKISFPKKMQDQRRIVTQLDALSSETQRLTRIYEQKLAALAELKKSLLHQAFSGDL